MSNYNKLKKLPFDSIVEYEVEGKLKRFRCKHNMPNQLGSSIENALENWLSRTNDYSVKSFCEYVKSKGFEIALFS